MGIYYKLSAPLVHVRCIPSLEGQPVRSTMVRVLINICCELQPILFSRKTPWKLSPTRKANQRKRLKRVDSVIEAVRTSGVECSSLVCILSSCTGPVLI